MSRRWQWVMLGFAPVLLATASGCGTDDDDDGRTTAADRELCERSCGLANRLSCGAEDPCDPEQCVDNLASQSRERECREEYDVALTCVFQQPDSSFECRDDGSYALTEGCEAETKALSSCLTVIKERACEAPCDEYSRLCEVDVEECRTSCAQGSFGDLSKDEQASVTSCLKTALDCDEAAACN